MGATVVHFVFIIIEFILGLRVILRLLGANPASPFAQWLYKLSDPLLMPFKDIFPTPDMYQGVLDLPSLFALIVYTFVGFLLSRFVDAALYNARNLLKKKDDTPKALQQDKKS